MKQAILLILAMLFAFAMPAQASEGYEGFSPATSYSVHGDAVANVTDNKVSTCRCTGQQLEAAVFTSYSKASYADEESALISGYALGYGATHEVGWRRSIQS
jgi:hypothetical protein